MEFKRTTDIQVFQNTNQITLDDQKSGYFTKPVKNTTNRLSMCHKQVDGDTKKQ